MNTEQTEALNATEEVSVETQETETTTAVSVNEATQEDVDSLQGNPYFDGNPFGNIPVINDDFNEKIKACNTEFVDFLEKNKDVDTLQQLSEKEKDELYGQSEDILGRYLNTLKTIRFNFPLIRDEHKAMLKVIEDKLEYGVNDLFLALRLKFDFLNKIGSTKYANDEVRVLSINIDTVSILFHLLSKHTCKGLGAESLQYAMVLRKLGEIKKTASIFEEAYTNMTKVRSGWTASMTPDPQPQSEGPNAEFKPTVEPLLS